MNAVSEFLAAQAPQVPQATRTDVVQTHPRGPGPGRFGLGWLLVTALLAAGWSPANAQRVTWTFVPESAVLPTELQAPRIRAMGGEGELVVQHQLPETSPARDGFSVVVDRVARQVFAQGDAAPGGGTYEGTAGSLYLVSADRLLFQVSVRLTDNSFSHRTFRWDNGQITYLPTPTDTEYRLDINDGQGRFLAVRYRDFDHGLIRLPVEYSITDGESISSSVQPLPIDENEPMSRGGVVGITPHDAYLVFEGGSANHSDFFTRIYYTGGLESVLGSATRTMVEEGEVGSVLNSLGIQINRNGDVVLQETVYSPGSVNERVLLFPLGADAPVELIPGEAHLGFARAWLTVHPQVIHSWHLPGGNRAFYTGPNPNGQFGGDFVTAFGVEGIVTRIDAFHQNGYIMVRARLADGRSVSAFGRAETSPEGEERVWNNPAGGAWNEADNWNPPEVPEHSPERSDTAVFSLSGQYPVNATGAQAGRMIVRNGIVDILGNAQLFTSSLDEPSLLVGNHGLLNVIGGTFRTVHSALGESSAAQGEMSVLNDGTRWENHGRLLVGDGGPGRLSVVNGFASALETRIGGGALAGGEVIVGGTTGRWDPGSVAVGFAGSGRLEIRDGGTVVSDTLLIGRAGAGEVLISRAEMVSRDLFVGENAEGVLRLEQGASLGSDEAFIGVGGSTGPGRGEVVVDGAGQGPTEVSSWLTVGLTVGGQAPGKLSILNGGRVTSLEQVYVGESESQEFDVFANGRIVIQGTRSATQPSRFNANQEMFLGTGTNAVADVQALDGGEISVFEDLYLGFEAGGSGLLLVSGVNASGARSRVRVGSEEPDPEAVATLRVGYHGAAVMTIEQGGLVTSPNLLIGGQEGSKGEVTVVGRAGGVQSELRVTGERFAVGGVTGLGSTDGVSGTLELNDGLVVTPGELWIGEAGALIGQGTIQAPTVVANGYLSPAFYPTVSASTARLRPANESETPPPGVLTLEGDLVLGPTGVIAVEIRGAESGDQTRVEVLGEAVLNGRLELNFGNGYAPRQGDQLRFLAAAAGLSGGFGEVRIFGLAPGFEYELGTAQGEVRLTALNDAAVAGSPRFAPLPLLTAGGLQLSVDAPEEQEVVIFAAPGVLLPAQPIHTNRGSFLFVDPLPAGEGQRFYRAVGR